MVSFSGLCRLSFNFFLLPVKKRSTCFRTPEFHLPLILSFSPGFKIRLSHFQFCFPTLHMITLNGYCLKSRRVQALKGLKKDEQEVKGEKGSWVGLFPESNWATCTQNRYFTTKLKSHHHKYLFFPKGFPTIFAIRYLWFHFLGYVGYRLTSFYCQWKKKHAF